MSLEVQPKVKKKFIKIKPDAEPVEKPAEKPAPEPEVVDFDFNTLMAETKKHIKDAFAPTEADIHKSSATDFVAMPGPIASVMGVPGAPCGLVMMVYGKKDCGKTTFATQALISAQRNGGIAILLDTENKYDLMRAKAMGLDVTRMIILKAITIEQAFEKFVTQVKIIKSNPKWAKLKVCCVWDSLGATPCDDEMDEDVEDFAMRAAKVIKGKLRKLIRYIRDTKVSFIIINQVYANMKAFGKQTTPYGGSGPEYHSAIMLEFSLMGRIRPKSGKSGEDFCGIRTKIECTKNHLAQPFKTCEVGIDWKGFVIDRDAEYAPEEFKKGTADVADDGIPAKKKRRDKEESEARD